MKIIPLQISKNIDVKCLVKKENNVINIDYQVIFDNKNTVVNCDHLEIEIHMNDQASEQVDHYRLIGINDSNYILYSKIDSAFLDEEKFKKLRIYIKTKRG
ncbi:hypothetical protein [Colwellia sp. MB3u-4]|uniref:hypothetical protein n=1 Tax=Colwellia sp. MB3u-4 TaxID=2759822 RepID=UPI0015F51584|nr:hypothetical protein [Colwellia sp. MB3u-4]MBA6287767.1 hypothetical protein [Colwellia sp. MB3u-4]